MIKQNNKIVLAISSNLSSSASRWFHSIAAGRAGWNEILSYVPYVRTWFK